MKTRKAKKFMSILLSVLMVISVLPMTAFAGTDAELSNLKTSITAYESKMDGTVYTNMSAAYSAYIYAKECVDSYEYGRDTTLDLATAKSNLDSAVANMAAFTGKTVTNHWDSSMSSGQFYVDQDKPADIGTSNPDDYYKNLLYAPVLSASAVENNDFGDSKDHGYVYYPGYVWMYDGKTTPTAPVMCGSWIDSGKTRYIYAMYPSDASGNDSTDLSLTGYWNADDGSRNHVWLMAAKGRNGSGYNKATGYNGNQSTDHRSSKQYNFWSGTSTIYLANTMQFTGSLNSGQYSKSIQSYWYGAISDGANSGGKTAQASTSLYVVNYKALLDTLGGTANVLQNIKNYDNDWSKVKTFMSAIDASTAFDPASSAYDYATNTVTAVAACASAIETNVNSVNTAKSALKASDTSYADLRTALSTAKSAFDIGNGNNTYTSDSWTAFATAYEAARAAMNDVDNNGYQAAYNGTAISVIASNLTTAYAGLETSVELADTDAILAAIADAQTIMSCSTYLTTDSASNLQTALANAVAAFENNDITLPTIYTVDQQTQVDSLTAALNTAIDGIVLSTTRLSTGLQTAKDIDQINVFDAPALIKSITNAESALDTAGKTKLTAANIVNVTSSYKTACEAIEEAIRYANQPYTVQPDAVTSSSSGTASVSWANAQNTSTFTYPKDVVIVKSSSAATNFNIGNYSYGLKSIKTGPSDGYAQLVYELGISNANSAATTGKTSVAQFSLTGFDGEVLAKGGGESVQGGMYYSTTAPASVNAGISDGSTDTYWWVKVGEFTRTSPVNFAAPALAGGKTPTISTYNCGYSYIYAKEKHYNWAVSENTVNDITETPMNVTVVDISPLLYIMDTVGQYTDLNQSKDYKWYTTESYSALINAISAAKLVSNSGAINTYASAQAYQTAVVKAWNDIKTAITGLTVANYNVVFNYKTATGADTTSTSSGEYGAAITAPSSVPNYVVGQYRYVFTGWDKDVATTITGNDSYTAQYSQELNKADFTALDNAVATLTTLADRTYSAADLTALDTFIKGLTYYNYDAATREGTMADKQTAINTELAAVQAQSLTASKIDITAAQAAIDTAKAAYDSDAYDTEALNNLNLYKNVTVNGRTVIGLVYTTQSSLDTAIANLVSSLSPVMYTVTLNGNVVGSFAYGTNLEVNGDGTYTTDPDKEVGTGNASYAWYYKYSSVQVPETSEKYMTTSTAYGFVVKGNTTLRTEKAQTEDAQSYVVTFVNGINGHVYDVQYTTGTVTVPAAPVCPFYTFNSYSDPNAVAGSIMNVSSNTTITANYTVGAIESYHVIVAGVGGAMIDDNFNYNDNITLTDADTEVWMKYIGTVQNEYGEDVDGWAVVAFGNTITFRACEECEYDGFTLEDYESMREDTSAYKLLNEDANGAVSHIRSGIVKADTKISMIGQFVIPANASVVEYGILFTKETGKTLTVVNSGTDSTIKRLKASKHTGENDSYGQYVISIKSSSLSGSYTFTYRSYLIYTMGGKTYTVYSNSPVTEAMEF